MISNKYEYGLNFGNYTEIMAYTWSPWENIQTK